jgi:hypothetical protein
VWNFFDVSVSQALPYSTVKLVPGSVIAPRHRLSFISAVSLKGPFGVERRSWLIRESCGELRFEKGLLRGVNMSARYDILVPDMSLRLPARLDPERVEAV